MSYIRFRKHYLHIPYLVLAALELVVLYVIFTFLALLLSLAGVGYPSVETDILSASLFALVLSCGTLAMGGYLAMVHENISALFFRTLIAYCFLGELG